MANQAGKSNPASKRMMNPTKKAKRVRNKAKNEKLRAAGTHPKQLRAAEQERRNGYNLEFMASLGMPKDKQRPSRVRKRVLYNMENSK